MENHEGTIIGIGCISLAIFGFLYHECKKEQTYNLDKKREIVKLFKNSKDNNHEINFSQIKKNAENVSVFIHSIRQDNVKGGKLDDKVYEKYIRERPKYRIMKVPFQKMNYYIEHAAGGTFTFNYKHKGLLGSKTEVEVDIKDCNIHSQALKEVTKDIHIFQENNSKDAFFEEVKIGFPKVFNLSLIGTIGYNITDKKFILEPSFIIKSFNNIDSIQENITSYYENEIFGQTVNKILLGGAIILSSVFLVYFPLKSLITRYKQKFNYVKKDDFEFFKNNVKYYAKNSGALNCEACRVNPVAIAYECGHLAICEQCHEAKADKKCLICDKVSKRFLKVFL